MSGLRAVGVVVAAGQSSRMEAFKPLLDVAGRPLLCRTIDSLLEGGVEQVIVVTGRNHQQVVPVLAQHYGDREILLLHNDRYRETDMLSSVKLALARAMEQQAEVVALLPGDLPCIRPESVRYLLRCFGQARPDALYPLYQDDRGKPVRSHPPLIHSRLLPQLLDYHGPGGLRGALEAVEVQVQELWLPDAGSVMDADYPQDYARICQYWPQRYMPVGLDCRILYRLAATPEPVQLHMIATARKAMELGSALQKRGYDINLPLLESAALLHDVCRTQQDHARMGAMFLRQYGLHQVADLVAVHMDWPAQEPVALHEAALLYLADKLVSGDQTVPLAQRFQQKLAQVGDDAQARAAIHRRWQIAEQMQQLVNQALEDNELYNEVTT